MNQQIGQTRRMQSLFINHTEFLVFIFNKFCNFLNQAQAHYHLHNNVKNVQWDEQYYKQYENDGCK